MPTKANIKALIERHEQLLLDDEQKILDAQEAYNIGDIQLDKLNSKKRHLQVSMDASRERIAELQSQLATAEELGAVDVNQELLQEAEAQYLSKLKQIIEEKHSNWRVIALSTEIVDPEGDILETEFFLKANRHQLTLVMEQGNTPLTLKPELSVQDAVDQIDLLMILGEPGSGKSWSLYDIAKKQIEKYETGQHYALPLLVNASQWHPNIKPREFLKESLIQILSSNSIDNISNDHPLVSRFAYDLDTGRYIVLIDGLNEMPQRKVPKQQFQREQKRIEYSDNHIEALRTGLRNNIGDEREWKLQELAESTRATRYVVTCRTLDYEPRTLPWRQAHIKPLTTNQIAEFVKSRLKYISTITSPDTFLQEIENNVVAKNLAGNPFYLEILVALFKKKEGELPRRRGELLGELVDLRLIDEIKKLTSPNLAETKEQCDISLGHLALRMLDKGYVGSNAPTNIIKPKEQDAVSVALKAGLISRSVHPEFGDSISFYHELIQEYYAAYGLSIGLKRVSVRRILRDQRWLEPIALWYELETKERRRRHIFSTLLSGLRQRAGFNNTGSMPCILTAFYLVFLLFLPVAVGALLVEILFGSGFFTSISNNNIYLVLFLLIFVPWLTWRSWKAWSIDLLARKHSAHVLAALPHPDSAPIAVDKMVSLLDKDTLIQKATIIDALVKLGRFSKERLKQKLYDSNQSARFAAAIALMRIGDVSESREVVDIISGDYDNIQELDFTDPNSMEEMMKERPWVALGIFRDFWINQMRNALVVNAMHEGKSGPILAPALMRKFQQSTNIFERAHLQSLLLGSKERLPSGFALSVEDNFEQNPLGAVLLVKVGDSESVENFFNLIETNRMTPQTLQQALPQATNIRSDAVPVLLDKLESTQGDIRQVSALMLSVLAPEEAVPYLLAKVEDSSDPFVQIHAMNALGKLQVKEAMNPLIQILEDDYTRVDQIKLALLIQTIETIGLIQEPESVPHLLDWLEKSTKIGIGNDVQQIIKLAVLQSLKKIPSPIAISDLGNILRTEGQNKLILVESLETIGEIGGEQAIIELDRLPHYDDVEIRTKLVEAIHVSALKQGSVDTLGLKRQASTVLESFLSDEDLTVRDKAQRAIAQLTPTVRTSVVVTQNDVSASRFQNALINYTGLGIARAYFQLMRGVYTKSIELAQQDNVEVRGLIRLSGTNLANQMKIMQDVLSSTQFSLDIFTGTSGLQRLGCNLFLIWLPALLISIGLFFLLRVPELIGSFSLSINTLVMWLSISIVSLPILIPGTRDQARKWLLPSVCGVVIGFPLYGLLLQAVPFSSYGWLWLLFIAIYSVVMYAGLRNRWDKRLPQTAVWLFISLPILPIAIPIISTFTILNYAYETSERNWWLYVCLGIIMGWGGWITLEYLNWLTPNISLEAVFFASIAIILVLLLYVDNKYVRFVFRSLSLVSAFLIGILSIPAFPIVLWLENEFRPFTKIPSEVSGDKVKKYESFAVWMSLLPSILIYLGIYQILLPIIPIALIVVVLSVVVLSYGISAILYRMILAEMQTIRTIALPAKIFFLPYALLTRLIFEMIIRIPATLANITKFGLKLIPSRTIRKIVNDNNLSDIVVGTMGITITIGLTLTALFYFRLFSTIPLTYAPLAVVVVVLWLLFAYVSITTYRKRDFDNLSVVIIPAVLPLIPVLVFMITVGLILVGVIAALEPTTARQSDRNLTNARQHLVSAQQAFDNGNYQRSIEKLTQASKVLKLDTSLIALRARSHLGLGEYALSINDFLLLTDIRRFHEDWTNLAFSYFLNGETQNAHKAINKAIRLSENNSLNFYWRALIKISSQDVKGAFTDLDRSYALEPSRQKDNDFFYSFWKMLVQNLSSNSKAITGNSSEIRGQLDTLPSNDAPRAKMLVALSDRSLDEAKLQIDEILKHGKKLHELLNILIYVKVFAYVYDMQNEIEDLLEWLTQRANTTVIQPKELNLFDLFDSDLFKTSRVLNQLTNSEAATLSQDPDPENVATNTDDIEDFDFEDIDFDPPPPLPTTDAYTKPEDTTSENVATNTDDIEDFDFEDIDFDLPPLPPMDEKSKPTNPSDITSLSGDVDSTSAHVIQLDEHGNSHDSSTLERNFDKSNQSEVETQILNDEKSNISDVETFYPQDIDSNQADFTSDDLSNASQSEDSDENQGE